MSSSPEPMSKRSYDRIPDALELKLLRALVSHVREHGSKRYDLIREDPEYAPWIGHAEGEKGRKRFRRLLDRITKPLPADGAPASAASALNADQEAWATQQLAANAATIGRLPIATPQLMSGGLPALLDIIELRRELDECTDDLNRIRDVALEDDPQAIGGRAAAIPDLLLKVAKARTELSSRKAQLYDRQLSLLRDHAFGLDLVAMISDSLADQPEKRALLLSGLQTLVRKHGGALPPGTVT